MKLNNARKLANEKLNEHGLVAKGWTFEYDNAVRRFGCTHFSTKTITLSKHLVELNEEPRVLNTILHEIAHALAGSGNGHNRYWRNIARNIGCDGNRLYDSSVVAAPKRKYTGTCPNCSRQVQRHRRDKIACGTCCRKFNNNKYDEQYLFTWTS